LLTYYNMQYNNMQYNNMQYYNMHGNLLKRVCHTVFFKHVYATMLQVFRRLSEVLGLCDESMVLGVFVNKM